MGDNIHNSSAMQDIAQKDQEENVLNQKKERMQLFKELKKYRRGGVTKKELKSILAGFKYGFDDSFDVGEINTLAKELGLGIISKKHLMTKSPLHNSRVDRANHDVNYSHKHLSNKNIKEKRSMPNDDIVHYEVQDNIKKIFGDKYKKMFVDGNMVFENEQEETEFFDVKTGKKFIGRSTQLKRPNFHVKSQTSLRGRGLMAGKRIYK